MRYFLDPFGCVKNQVDAENMMAHLNSAGWESAPEAESADLIIVNSCGFIESAKQESINAVLGWRKLYPGKKILLAGCLAQRYAKELAESLPEADALFGNTDLAGITGAASRIAGSLVKRAARKAADTVADDAATVDSSENSGQRPLLSLPGSAYVKISEGCDNRCAFCAIPLIRGGLQSRAIADILEECRGLLARGVRELCIIGQDIGSFGTDYSKADYSKADYSKADYSKADYSKADDPGAASMLPELLKAIATLDGRFWVRLLYIHPDRFPLQILDIMERDARFLPYFDIPFQHASPKILSAMNRHGTAETYLALLETIRRRLPRAVIRSTFLLGFPGETDDDFAALLDFQEKAGADWLGCFTWSREEGTAAYSMKGRVSKKTAAERKRIVEERQIPITEKNMDRFVGQILDVLIEEKFENSVDTDGIDADGETLWLGRVYCQAPDIDGATVIVSDAADGLRPGMLVPGKVIARRGFDLELTQPV
ncbi:ribosomal protein S12 methylthiotransferase RimO [Spirochaetia bacterium]|nr:ribosomal protein S12 methylthiotransferase RimO [Spirochaetia bacterium]